MEMCQYLKDMEQRDKPVTNGRRYLGNATTIFSLYMPEESIFNAPIMIRRLWAKFVISFNFFFIANSICRGERRVGLKLLTSSN